MLWILKEMSKSLLFFFTLTALYLDVLSIPQLHEAPMTREDWLNPKLQFEEFYSSHRQPVEERKELEPSSEVCMHTKLSTRLSALVERVQSVQKSHEERVEVLERMLNSRVEELQRQHAAEMDRLTNKYEVWPEMTTKTDDTLIDDDILTETEGQAAATADYEPSVDYDKDAKLQGFAEAIRQRRRALPPWFLGKDLDANWPPRKNQGEATNTRNR